MFRDGSVLARDFLHAMQTVPPWRFQEQLELRGGEGPREDPSTQLIP